MMWLSTFFTHGSRSTTIGSTSRPVLAVVGVVGLLLLFLSIAGITQIAEAIQPGALVTGSTTEASTSLITSTKRSSGGVPPGDGPLPPAGATLLPGEQEQEVDKAKNSVLTTLDPPNPGADEASKERSFAAEHKNDHNAAHLAGAEQPSSSAPATAFSWLQYQHLLPSWLGGGGGRSGGQQALSSAGTATPRRFGNLRGSKNKHARAQEALAGGTPTDGGAVPSSSLTPEDLPGGSSPFSPDAAMPAEQEASALSRRSSDLLSDDAPMEFRSDAGDGGGNQFAAGSGTKRGAENAGFLEKEKATGNTNANSAAAQARVEHQNENTYCNGDSCSSPSPSSTTGTTGRTTAAAGRSTAVQQQEQLQQQQQLHASPSVVSTGTTSTPDVERLQKELRAALGKVTELDKALKNAQTKIHQLEEEKARSAAREEFVIELEQHVAKLEGELLAKNGNVSPPKDYEEAWYRALRANEECFRQLVDQKLRIEELEHSDKSSGSGAGTKLEEGLQAKNQMPVVVIPGKVVPQDYEENCHRALHHNEELKHHYEELKYHNEELKSLLNGQALPRIEELEHAQNRGAAKKLIAGIKPRTYSNQILAKNPATQEHFKQVLYGAKRDGPGAGIVRFRMFSGTNIYPKNVWENDGLYTWFVADFSYAGQGTPSWKIHASTYVSVTDFTVKHYNNEKIVSVFVYSADYYNPCESEKFLAGGEKAVHDRAINAGLSNALSPKTSFPSEAEQLRAWYAETLAATVGKMLGNFSLRIGMTLLGTSRFSSSLRPGHKLWIGVVEIFAVYDELFRRATGTLPQQVKNVAEHLHLMSWEGAPFLARYDENGKKTQEKIAEIECLIYVLGTVSNAFTDSFESRSEQGKRQKEKKGIAIPDGRVFLDEDTPRFAAPWSDHASKIPC